MRFRGPSWRSAEADRRASGAKLDASDPKVGLPRTCVRSVVGPRSNPSLSTSNPPLPKEFWTDGGALLASGEPLAYPHF